MTTTFSLESLTRLSEQTAYEAWLLEDVYRIHDNLVISPERDRLLLLPNSSILKHYVLGVATCHLGDWRPGFIEACSPLGFVTAFKLLDMVLEWILLENGKTATHRFQQKISALQDSTLEFPPPIDKHLWLRERLLALYEQLDPLRGTVIHSRHFQTTNGNLTVASSRGGVVGTPVSMSNQEIRTLAVLLTRLRRYVLRDWKHDAYREKLQALACDELVSLHSLPSLCQLQPVFTTVRAYLDEREPLIVDLEDLRVTVQVNYPHQDVVFDLRLVTVLDGEMVDALWLPWNQLQVSSLSISSTDRVAIRVALPAEFDV